jgi:hypothetical protein
VVGAAGTAKTTVRNPTDKPDTVISQEAGGSPTNGSLTNISGRNLLSAVAGSVDSIAAIRLAKNIVIDGILGADKGVYERDTTSAITLEGFAQDFGFVTRFDYLDANGMLVSEPALGGKLIDGAVVASAIKSASGSDTSLGSRSFLRGNS